MCLADALGAGSADTCCATVQVVTQRLKQQRRLEGLATTLRENLQTRHELRTITHSGGSYGEKYIEARINSHSLT